MSIFIAAILSFWLGIIVACVMASTRIRELERDADVQRKLNDHD